MSTSTVVLPAAPESLLQKVEGVFEKDATKVLTVMEAVAKDALKALSVVTKYLPTAAALTGIIFPAQTAAIGGVVNSVQLIQQAVATVEQKMAAGGAATGTGAQKLADVLQIVTPVVTDLFAKEGLKINETQITGIVNAVVAILNVQTTPVTAA